MMYRPSLLVVSGDREFISQIESALAWRFAVVPVAKMNEVSAVRGGPECVAVVLHLHPPVINGYA
ncbi:MAG: hypothetical protein H5U08_11065, partial [Thermogutta sp.]|uniref:hypothetical protein n=1 Tax=Thermogutta sp. TaxID=1962930 RepID=UPI0019A717E6